jgi:hypothetical protein
MVFQTCTASPFARTRLVGAGTFFLVLIEITIHKNLRRN